MTAAPGLAPTVVDLETHGHDWLLEQVEALTDEVNEAKPSEIAETLRYLPSSVSPNNPGPFSFDLTPYAKEIVDNFDINSPIRETTVLKGVQVAFTTSVLENIVLYLIEHVKTAPSMYVTADKELAEARIENYFLPMLEHSGLSDRIQSGDVGNSRKTGKTKNMLQWQGGGWMKPIGSLNAAKMRQDTILYMLKDELSGWPEAVGKDGDPDKLTDDRCKGLWERRKILRGSTPNLMDTDKTWKAYLRGDQRKYFVPCKHCGFFQYLAWGHPDPETGYKDYGIIWDLDMKGQLINESVRYRCMNCQREINEYDKRAMFAFDSGAEWRPTAAPKELNVRSYHLPAFYSATTMAPWYALVADFLEAYDPKNQRVKDIEKYKTYVNNVKGKPFQVTGFKLTRETVNALRRDYYHMGTVPNRAARLYSGGPVVFLTCQVDVHKEHLDVAVMGWSRGSRCHLIDYFLIQAVDATDENDPCWADLATHIEDKTYSSDHIEIDGELEYKSAITFIDSRYASDAVLAFCEGYENGVFPILGISRQENFRNIAYFQKFTPSLGGVGYKITVDFYKDMLSTVLRREWSTEMGPQGKQHFSAPRNTTDAQLKELTTEYKKREKDTKGNIKYVWYRPQNVRNELWDLLVYGHCAKDVMAHILCIDVWGEQEVNWSDFWDYYEGELLK